MASERNERDLIKKRGTIKSKLTTFIKFVDLCEESEKPSLKQLRIRIARIEKDVEEFEVVQSALEQLASDDDYDTRLTERSAFEDAFCENLARAQELVEALETQDTIHSTQTNPQQLITAACPSINPRNESGTTQPIASTGVTNQVQSALTVNAEFQVKLPTMQLPQFSGLHEAWPGFFDAFKSAIHENSNLRDVQKLMYLRSCLTGKAAEKIESLETTGANYLVAWNMLEKYYDDPSIVINKRIQAFFELPACTRYNANSLNELVDRATNHYRALQALNKPFLEAFPMYAITSKLDEQTRFRWKESIQGKTLPSMDDLLEFLHQRRKVLECSTLEKPSKPIAIQSQTHMHVYKRDQVKANRPMRVLSVINASCYLCKGKHLTQACPKFTGSNSTQRSGMVKAAGLCNNCLRPNHIAKNCYASTCKRCKGKHHTLLHQEQDTDQQPAIQANLAALGDRIKSEVLLYTVVVNIPDRQGRPQSCRIILDSGSQAHFLTERIVERLGLSREATKVPILGFDRKITNITSMTTAQVQSRINSFHLNAEFLILPSFIDAVPSRQFSKAELEIPQNLPLADPNFNIPSFIDGIIGAELFVRLLCVGQISTASDTIVLQKTKFGWIPSGRIPVESIPNNIQCNLAVTSLEGQISKFWEVEEPPREKVMSHEERECEEHYRINTTRDTVSGKYITKLPFNSNIHALGDSYSVALKRFHSLERRLIKSPELRTKYVEFLNEYHVLGHMTRINSGSTEEGYYLPHHAVIKENSITTKLRVVFDASAKTSSGISLNDSLLTGPTIQDDLYSLLIRFRVHTYVITADIAKMYRQVLIHPEHQKYQKILWREDPHLPIDTYTLNTVTYGTSAAPFLAIRSLHQLAQDEAISFPRAARVLREDFYVDDLLTGANSYEEVIAIRDELINLCVKGGFELRQWAANDESLIQDLKNKTNETHLRLDLDDTIKTLGICWHAKQDSIMYTVKELLPTGRVTKRNILSQIATLFDPLGLLGPIIIRAKILMQELWKLSLHWDESVPIELHTRWQTYCREMILLRELKIKRQVATKGYVAIHLHGFCDASEQAYGACLYLRSVDGQGKVSTQLISSKSRVAPLKTITLPRLELCAAHLLSNLYKATIHALRKLKFEKVMFWSDSTIALHWIKTSPHMLKTFVAHRVADIQATTGVHEWRHVCSEQNPADVISRGVTVQGFLHNKLWHHGPCWLQNGEDQWPAVPLEQIQIPETRPLITLSAQISTLDVWERFSSFTKLKRVIAYVLRFYFNSSRKENHRGALSASDLQRSQRYIMKTIQQTVFKSDIHALNASGQLTKYLAPLNPFKDSDGILRVGGRLSRANLNFGTRHPILLPKNHSITESIIREYHIKNFHSGIQSTLNAIRLNFWIPNGKSTVRKIIHACVTCYRAKPPLLNYKMGDLPAPRVIFSRPFLQSGVDFCGPIWIKEKTQRNRGKIKVYIAVFVCFATKATHIEIVGDLSTEAFLASLRRFFARRGRSSDIYSDNATNFVGARREIKELFALLNSRDHNEKVTASLSNEGINWHLIPPRAPHFGGLWEAAVRSVRHHLTRVIGDTLLSYEALLTYVNQIEAILNSRPITPVSSDPNDLTALTPAHFLIGESLTSIPDHDFTAIPSGRLSSWQHVQKMRAHFWKRWYKDYLQEQTVR